MELIAKNLQETEKLAIEFVDKLVKAPSKDRATVVLLKGDLGSGKTAFTKAMAKALGVTETITSPTFIIEKAYKLKNKKFQELIHIDAYRFEEKSEARVLELEVLYKSPQYLIVIEWPERIGETFPEDAIEIHFTFLDEDRRSIHFNA